MGSKAVAPRVSVVIPTLDGGQEFRACLEAVRRQELDRPYEVICVDSGSTDGTLDTCREFGVRIVEIDRGAFNHGLTRNMAIEAARGEFVALLTQDAVPLGANWLRHHVDALESRPDAAGSYGRQILRDGVNPFLRWRLEHWTATRPERSVQRIDDEAAFDAATPLEKLAIVAFDDVNSCLRRSVWESIPFSEVEFGEDIDWALRAVTAGHSIVYEPGARVLHSHDHTLRQDFDRVYADHRNLNRLLGMKQVSRPLDVLRSTVSGVRSLWASVPLDEYPLRERLYWRFYAIPWSFVQAAAQYMGARSNERSS
jgi:rhamnosyltransferase